MDTTTATALDRLLDHELDFSVGARGGFNNHLPMQLVAAARLGATDDLLGDITTDQEHSDLLLPRERPDWLAPLTAEVTDRGTAAVVAERLPDLVDSPTTHWFHAMIRLEYALDADHPGQVANSLHDWAAHRRPLAPLPAPGGSTPLVEVARVLHRRAEASGHQRSSIEAVTYEPWFADALADADLGAGLDGAAELARLTHVVTNDILSLHLVTGARAASVIAAVPTVDVATRHRLSGRIAQAVLAGYVTAGVPDLPTDADLGHPRSAELPGWEEIASAALASGDAHVMKLAYSCRSEQARRGDRLYRWLAARQSEILAPDDATTDTDGSPALGGRG